MFLQRLMGYKEAQFQVRFFAMWERKDNEFSTFCMNKAGEMVSKTEQTSNGEDDSEDEMTSDDDAAMEEDDEMEPDFTGY